MKTNAASAILTALALASWSAYGDGTTFHVANHGVDSPTCGRSSSPCRSITQAMDNAVGGDTILVGTGRYGDINDNGSLFDPGDERNSGTGCLICITKPLRIVSVDGPLGTVIDAGVGSAGISTAVAVLSSDVVFGAVNRGFTISNSSVTGLSVRGPVNNVSIVGNIASMNHQAGFAIQGEANFGIRSLRIADNIATGNGTGISTTLDSVDGADFRRNILTGNARGAVFAGRNIRVVENVINGNVQGALLDGSEISFQRNAVTNSGREGVFISALDVPSPDVINLRQFSLNTVVGNRGPGISIGRFVTVTSIRNNNIFGNGTGWTTFADEPRPNCGLYNVSQFPVNATSNFWGARTGPGPDPADDVCDVGESATRTQPVRPSSLPSRPLD